MRGTFFFALAGALILLCQCATPGTSSMRYHVVLRQDAFVTAKGGKPERKPGGEVLEYTSEELPLFVQKPGYLGVFIVPTSSHPERIDVQLPPFDPWSSDWGQHFADLSLQDVLQQTAKIQHLFATNQAAGALDKIEALQQKYPRILTLKFLKASCLMLMGEKLRAQTVLEEALRAWPNNPEGLTLYHSLTGHDYAGEKPSADPLPAEPEAGKKP